MRDFRGKTAWFSSSISKECKQVWLKGSGKQVNDIKHADYIFANDSSVPEMCRFFQSRLFLEKGVQAVKSTWLLDDDKSIFDCILYPEDFKDSVSANEQTFKDEISSPSFHIFEELHSQSQDSESTFCLEDYEIKNSPNHDNCKASPNKVIEANYMEQACENEIPNPTFSSTKESGNVGHVIGGRSAVVHGQSDKDYDDDDKDDYLEKSKDDNYIGNDNQEDHGDDHLKSKTSIISPAGVQKANLSEWDIVNFEDEGSSPAFHRLKDFRRIYSSDEDKMLGLGTMSSKALNKKTGNGKEKSSSGLLEEQTKEPMPSQNGYTLKKMNPGHYQGIVSPVICSHQESKKSTSSHRGTKKLITSSQGSTKRSASSIVSHCHENTRKPASTIITCEDTRTRKTRKTRKQAVAKRVADKNSVTGRQEDRHHTAQDGKSIDDADTISLKLFTEQDAAMLIPSSVSLRELEIPTHVFHSSMHDGFTRLEDIELPEGLQLQDFFTNSDEKTASEYQVYLRFPPFKVPKS